MTMRFFISQHRFAKFFYPKVVNWKIPVSDKTIFLSFDDGPVPAVTAPLLDILDHYRVKATFFCVGDNVFHHHDLYKDILGRGHKTGNHTFHHLNGWNTKTSTYIDDVVKCNKLVDTTLLRPPYGKLRPAQVMALKKAYTIILWSVLSYDYDKEISEDKCFKICMENLESGNIFVFHDSLKAGNTMLSVIPRFIEAALQQGYKFAVIPDHL